MLWAFVYLCFVSSSYDVGYPVLEQPTRVNETKPHIGVPMTCRAMEVR